MTGEGITPTTIKVQRDFRVTTTLSLTWGKTATGLYIAADRGSTNDQYGCTIEVVGLQTEINSILTSLEANRVSTDAGKFTLSNFASDELIFGSDITNTSIEVRASDIGDRKQTRLNLFSVSIKLKVCDVTSLTFTGSSLSTINLNHVSVGYEGFSEQSYIVHNMQSDPLSMVDKRIDTGVITIDAQMRNSDVIDLRRTLATKRSAPITFIAKGVSYPFGPNRSSTLTGKVLRYSEDGPIGQQYKKIQLTIYESGL